ncbi:hypothetical protein ACFQ88_23145 [Paenibacillus sp. NPDC056579]|uniref:hypothetical protein n=1 Tax=Paenibacillus sp. NPDC056579 TaxID=3345871 RepID=UPI0036A6D77A
MKFNLKKPCRDCPFLHGSSTNVTLAEGRLEGIARDLMSGLSFPCHKTLDLKSTNREHCAGALLYLEREERPNQIMRIAERLGLYDHTKLEQCSSLIEPIH